MAIVTWNPNDKGSSIILSNNNLIASGFTTTNNFVRATEGKTNGKWYFEYIVTTDNTNSRLWVGFANQSFTNYSLPNNYIRAFDSRYSYFFTQGNGSNNYQNTNLSVSKFGSVVGFAIDLDNKIFDLYIDNTKINLTTALSGKNIRDISDFGSNVIFPIALTINSYQSSVTAKFCSKDFTYVPPTDFLPYGYSPITDKFLIQDGNNICNTDGNSLAAQGYLPYTKDQFNNYGMDDLSKINNNVIQRLNNQKYKIALYKK